MDDFENTELGTFIKSILTITDIDDENLTEEAVETLKDKINENFSSILTTQSVNLIIKNLEDQGLNKAEAKNSIEGLKEVINELVYGEEELSGFKKELTDFIVNKIFAIFDQVVSKYHSFSIELPIKLEEGAKVPTYAHDTDAAADLYALETTVVEGNKLGNKIRTGVSIQLPEGWLALIIPRSSIGAKTPFRLSNSVGLIDSGYRGELGVLYDNISDTPYTINQGDRIAQLLVMPSYRFQAKVVDSLEDSDRGEGGFGSTGA